MPNLNGKKVLLVVSGGIAAYKCLELIRRLGDRGVRVRCVLTAAGAQFVTPLSLSAISGERVFEDLFSLNDENEIGHIRLSREADLVVVAPASADILARMAVGMANDLATAVLLATDKPVLVAPAMNPFMWNHAATQDNLRQIEARGVMRIGPNKGDMAEQGEAGWGRMAEPTEILAAITTFFGRGDRLKGLRCLVTSGPTLEPIDPVRFLANRSSGRQGHAIATALARMGAETTLVSGPTRLTDPPGLRTIHVETAREMLAACQAALPADVAVCAAAVADWRVAEESGEKIKKQADASAPALNLVANPDILASLSAAGPMRPRLVVGFAAETQDIEQNAANKRRTKGCDWILANDVSAGTETFGGADNTIRLFSGDDTERWPTMSKEAVAERLAERIADTLSPAP